MHSKNQDKYLFALILIFLVGFFLRCQDINKDFQRDESRFMEAVINFNQKGTLTYNEKSIGENLITVFDHHPPLYITTLSLIVKFFGTKIILVRSFMIFFSLTSIIIIFLLGKEYGKVEYGLIAALLLSINRLHVEYSQQIDIDGSFLTFFFLSSFLFFKKWLNSKKEKYYYFFVIFTILSLLTKITAFIWVFSICLFFIFQKKYKYLFNFSVLTLTIFFIILFLFSIYHSINYFKTIPSHMLKSILSRQQSNIFYRIYEFVGILTWEVTLPFLILSFLSIIYLFKKNIDPVLLFGIIYFLVNSLIFGISRYFVPVISLYCLFIGIYFFDVTKNKTKKIIPIVFVSTIIFLYLLQVRTDVAFLKDVRNNFVIISIPYIISLIAFFIYRINKILSLLLLFSLTISFGLYFSQEAINPLFSPKFYKSISFAANFIDSLNDSFPIITSHDISYKTQINFYESDIYLIYENFLDFISKHEHFYVIDYRTNSFLENKTKYYLDVNCSRISYTDKNVEILLIYRC